MSESDLPAVPIMLQEAFKDWAWSIAWAYYPGKAVHRIESPAGEVCFVKLSFGAQNPPLGDDAVRLRWARAFLPVPEVLGSGTADGLDWLVSRALAGVDATAPELLAEPEPLVAALGRGLRRFHEKAPVGACPFDFRLAAALPRVRQRASSLTEFESSPDAEHQNLSLAGALAKLEEDRPAQENLVICHGDFCFPNVVIEDGMVIGYLDLGDLGVADRWRDIAIGAWSTIWNLGTRYEDLFYEAYGIEPDRQKIAYYRLLYDLVS